MNNALHKALKSKMGKKKDSQMYTSPTGSKHRVGGQKHKYWEALKKRGMESTQYGD